MSVQQRVARSHVVLVNQWTEENTAQQTELAYAGAQVHNRFLIPL